MGSSLAIGPARREVDLRRLPPSRSGEDVLSSSVAVQLPNFNDGPCALHRPFANYPHDCGRPSDFQGLASEKGCVNKRWPFKTRIAGLVWEGLARCSCDADRG